MNTSIRKFYDIDDVDMSSASQPVSETEMKIFRAAGYNAEKVETIKELMEEEAIRFLRYYFNTDWSFTENIEGKVLNINTGNHKTLQEVYKESKTK